jgi:hypothetical protein
MLPLTKANQALEKDLQSLDKDSPEYVEKQKQLTDNLKAIGKINKDKIQPRREQVQLMQEVGGLAGRILLALGLVWITSKRLLLWCFQVPGLVIVPVVWFWVFQHQPQFFTWGVFFAGACIVAQFSYFGEYLPKVFPIHLRGTGGAFATNVGGRMIGTSAAFLTTGVIAPMVASWSGGGPVTPGTVAVAAGVTGVLIFVIGLLASFFLTEPTYAAGED